MDLSLVLTNELSEELTKRFDAIIIYGIQKDMKANKVSNYFDHYVGDQATLIGLCELLKDILKEDFKNNGVEPTE